MITGEGYDPKTITVETRIGSKDTIHIDVITSYSKLKFIPGIYNGVCPICGKSDSLREFAYGLPTSEGLKNRKRKNQISGGCIISDKNPKFRCVRDSVDFQ
jgi:hypothetical protein